MPRQPRFLLPGYLQHIIVRGNNRAEIFNAPEDYKYFLYLLEKRLSEHDCALHAYVLMTNHLHFLITPNTPNGLSKLMQSLGRSYVQYFNRKYNRTGTLWEGRFKACLVDSESYALTCYRYIELNPVRAAMVNHPADYTWSSYHVNAGGKSCPVPITPHELYKRLGTTPGQRQHAYAALFKTHLATKDIEQIRIQTNLGWALGNEHFIKRLEAESNRPLKPQQRGGDRRSVNFKRV